MKKTILLVVAMLMASGVVVAWDPNPSYNPFEVIWNYLDNVSSSWIDGSGKVTTDVNVTAEGIIESKSGFKFPDGSVQASSNIKQLINDFVVASGENVSAGDVVSFLNGYVQKGFVHGNDVIYGSEYVFNSADTTYTSAAALSPTRFVVAYRDEGNSHYGTAVIGEVSGNSITYGLEYMFNPEETYHISVAALSPSKFVVTYMDRGNYDHGTAVIGDVSGSMITYGSEYVFNTPNTYFISVAALSPSKFVIIYRDGANSHGTAIVGDVSGSTITYGSEYVFNSATTIYDSVAALSSTKFVVAYMDYDNSEYGTAVIGDVSGNSITFGSEYVFNSASTGYNSVAALSSTKFVVAYVDRGNSYYGTAIIGNISGSTITYGSEYVFNPASTDCKSVDALSSTKFVVAYGDSGNSNYGTAIIGNISGSTITYGSEYVFNSASTSYNFVAALSSTKFVVTFTENDDKGNALVGGYIHYGNLIGIAKESKTAGQTVPVIIGGVSDIHSGLTSGEVYYIDTSGELTTDETDYEVGLAISSNDIALTNNDWW